MPQEHWCILLLSLYEYDGCFHWLPGVSLWEWLDLREHDYDEVDRFIIDLETIGGG